MNAAMLQELSAVLDTKESTLLGELEVMLDDKLRPLYEVCAAGPQDLIVNTSWRAMWAKYCKGQAAVPAAVFAKAVRAHVIAEYAEVAVEDELSDRNVEALLNAFDRDKDGHVSQHCRQSVCCVFTCSHVAILLAGGRGRGREAHR